MGSQTVRHVKDADVTGKRVLVRVDFNVPLSDGRVADDTRIQASLPTIRFLVERYARVILMSHLGRPKGRDASLSLRPVASHLGSLLGRQVAFADDCIGAEPKAKVEALQEGDILVLENLRFRAQEKANDAAFAATLAELADVYVNDAFGTAHRAHASTVGVAQILPAYAGFLMAKELDVLGGLLQDPARPFVGVLGGAKVSGKIDVIENLLGKLDAILIGGAMAFTFSRAMGGQTGDSLVEEDRVETARGVLAKAKTAGVDIVLPADVVVTRDIVPDGDAKVVPFGQVPEGWKGADVGPETVKAFGRRIAGAKTVLMNGPVGVFEIEKYRPGTRGVMEAMVRSDATTILGGGDSAAAAQACDLAHSMTHVSTGGGASLEFLEGKTLPGVAALGRNVAAAR